MNTSVCDVDVVRVQRGGVVGGVEVRHVWQSCEKRRDGKRLQQTTVQVYTTTIFCRLSVYCERAWQCGRMCMRVILHIVGNCIDAYLE